MRVTETEPKPKEKQKKENEEIPSNGLHGEWWKIKMVIAIVDKAMDEKKFWRQQFVNRK